VKNAKGAAYLIVCIIVIFFVSCGNSKMDKTQGGQKKGGITISMPVTILTAKIIRAGADQGDPSILEKDEFIALMGQVSADEGEQIEQMLFGKNIPNDDVSRMDTFRTTYFKGYELSNLLPENLTALEKENLKLIWEYTSAALGLNRFQFVPNSSISNDANKDLFTDKMVNASDYLYLCLGSEEKDPQIEGVKVLRLPKPTKTKDGLMYMPGSALEGKECIVYVPEPWFGAGSQHKGFYPHDYSITLNMLLELAKSGDTEFVDMIGYSFKNFKAIAETIGHIPNANKSWSIGDTSRTQTNTLASQVLLYAKYLQKTNGTAAARKWLTSTGLPIAKNNLGFLTAERAKTSQGLYLFVPIGMKPDGANGDVFTYTSEMHNSPVLHNFYFERVLKGLIDTYESRNSNPNYCSSANCLKYIEEVVDEGTIAKIKPRDLKELIAERKDLHGIDGDALNVRNAFAGDMDGYVFVWDHPVRGEELIIKSGSSDKYYRLTNYALGSDQAMRASGFDPSDMAGLNSLDALDTAYAGHNAQLYRQMMDMAEIYKIMGKNDPASSMQKKASALKNAIIENMWSPSHGELVAFHQGDGRVDYRFYDMSYALWANLFDVSNPGQRNKLMSIVRNISDYEGPEGPYASTDWSGHNWGWGKVWPVMAAYSVMGLRDYAEQLNKDGFKEEATLCEETAQRIALKWLYSNAEIFAKEFGFGENLAVRQDGEPLGNVYGYDVDTTKGGNYTWHVAITRWLYTQLTPESRQLFESFYSALKKQHPEKL